MRSVILLLFVTLESFRVETAKVTSPINLSYYFDNKTIYWGNGTRFHFTKVFTDYEGDVWYSSNEFEAAEHGGTHMDAPYHFNKQGWNIGDIPFERFFGEGVVIDASREAKGNGDYLLPKEKLEEWEEENGPIPKGAIILFNFGWAKKYTNENKYFGKEKNNSNSLHFPGISKEAAEWIVDTNKVYGVGLDTPSIDYGQSQNFPAHQVLLGKNIYVIENVALKDTDLPYRGFGLIALPMNIRYGTGAPCRVVAIPNAI